MYIQTYTHVYTGSINVRDNGTKVYHYLSYAARSNLLPSPANRRITLDRERERDEEEDGRSWIFNFYRPANRRNPSGRRSKDAITVNARRSRAERSADTRRGTLVSSPRFFVIIGRVSRGVPRSVTGNGRKRESNGDFTIGVGRWVRSSE